MPLLLPPATATASTTAFALLYTPPLLLLTLVAQCRCRWKLVAHKSAAARGALWQLVRCRSSSRCKVPVWRCIRRQFFSECECRVRVLKVTVQDRIDCSFSAGCTGGSSVYRRQAASSCSLFACASDGVSRAGRLSLTRSIVPPLQLLLTIAHQLLLSGSLCNLGLQPRLFRSLLLGAPPSRSLPPRRSRG